jgi:hypothetical protein
MNLRRTKAIARKEFLHIIRDPRSLVMALAMPLLLLLLFGYALTLDVDRIPTLVYDADQSPQSRELIERLQGSRYFTVLGQVDNIHAIELAIDRNQCLLGVVIPHDYARLSLGGKEVEVQLLLDGSDSNTAAIARGYAESVVQIHALELRSSALNRKGAADMVRPAVETRMRVWYNADMKSRNYIVPGLIAVINTWQNVGFFLRWFDRHAGGHGRGGIDFPGAPAWQSAVGLRHQLSVSLRRVGLGYPDFHHRPSAAPGVSNGHAFLLSTGYSAVRLHLVYREHASDHPGHYLYFSRPLLRHHFKRYLP